MRFIEVDSNFDHKVSINVEAIADVYQKTNGCEIGLIGSSDNFYAVKQSYDEVMMMIREEDMH